MRVCGGCLSLHVSPAMNWRPGCYPPPPPQRQLGWAPTEDGWMFLCFWSDDTRLFITWKHAFLWNLHDTQRHSRSWFFFQEKTVERRDELHSLQQKSVQAGVQSKAGWSIGVTVHRCPCWRLWLSLCRRNIPLYPLSLRLWIISSTKGQNMITDTLCSTLAKHVGFTWLW